MDYPRITVIVRFHDGTHVQRLRRALHSLHAQRGVSVSPIIVCQRFSASLAEALRSELSQDWYFKRHGSLKVLNFQDGRSHDARSALINEGLKHHFRSDARYVAFLDYDDLVSSTAYQVLIEDLRDTGSVISFGKITRLRAAAAKDFDFVYDEVVPAPARTKFDLLKENFCPIHSFVIDTAELKLENILFNEQMSRVEDYEMLVRLVSSYPSSFRQIDTVVGFYLLRSDGSNSTIFGNEDTLLLRMKAAEWNRNNILLNQTKSRQQVRIFASDYGLHGEINHEV